MNTEEKIILSFVILASFITLILISGSPPTSFQVAGGCGNGICEPGESPLTCPQDCSAAAQCGNGVCEPGETFDSCPQDCGTQTQLCGNGICESLETCSSCPLDCGECDGGGSGGGGGTGGGGTGNQTDGQPPPEDPTDFPPEIPAPEEGETVELPPEGASIELEEGVTLGLFPLKNFNATVYNLSRIDPGAYRLLLCNQTSVASWEINVSADLAYLCVDYSKYNIEEPTLSVYRFVSGNWTPLSPTDIVLNTEKRIICGKIASTPYLVSGFAPTPTSRIAFQSIVEANSSIYSAREQGFDVSLPLQVLNQAWGAYYICDFTLAKNLADQAKELLVSLPFSVVLIISTIVAAAWYNYYRVKMRVKIKQPKAKAAAIKPVVKPTKVKKTKLKK